MTISSNQVVAICTQNTTGQGREPDVTVEHVLHVIDECVEWCNILQIVPSTRISHDSNTWITGKCGTESRQTHHRASRNELTLATVISLSPLKVPIVSCFSQYVT